MAHKKKETTKDLLKAKIKELKPFFDEQVAFFKEKYDLKKVQKSLGSEWANRLRESQALFAEPLTLQELLVYLLKLYVRCNDRGIDIGKVKLFQCYDGEGGYNFITLADVPKLVYPNRKKRRQVYVQLPFN